MFVRKKEDGSIVEHTERDPATLFVPSIADKFVEISDKDWQAHLDAVEAEKIPSEEGPDTQLSKLGFLRLFTADERVDIRGSTDVYVKDAMELVDLAEYIDLVDPETIGLVNTLESKALIGTGRADEILTV